MSSIHILNVPQSLNKPSVSLTPPQDEEQCKQKKSTGLSIYLSLIALTSPDPNSNILVL